MEAYPTLGFNSHDRFFPNQDTLPRKGFGNLIALPLQKAARQYGNSLFLDEGLQPIEDQWAFLAQVKRSSPHDIEHLVAAAEKKGRVLGVRLTLGDEDNTTPWKAPVAARILDNLPKQLHLVLSNELFIEKAMLPAPLQDRLICIAAFQNPDFYKAQAMRLPVYDKPRIIGCARDYSHHIGLPSGCMDEVVHLLNTLKITYTVQDERLHGQPLACSFRGELREAQQVAMDAISPFDSGVLSGSMLDCQTPSEYLGYCPYETIASAVDCATANISWYTKQSDWLLWWWAKKDDRID